MIYDGSTLTEVQRTEELFDGSDVTLICGCQFWREALDGDSTHEYEDRIMVTWCARHTTMHILDAHNHPEETPT